MKDQKGFTLIEALLAGAVIIAIGIGAAMAVNSARANSRDAVRLSQLRITQSALDNFYNENNSYPVNENLPLGDGAQSACLSAGGFQADCSAEAAILLGSVRGTVENGLKNLAVCGVPPRNAFCYSSFSGGLTYRIQFELENNWPQAGLVKGINCAYPEGLESGRCRLP